jgi:uncharacterized RDD family membrane protein YckC
MSAVVDRPPRAKGSRSRTVTSPALREVERYQGRRAGIVSRLVANTVDFVVVVSIVFGGYLVVSTAIFLWSPPSFRFPQPSGGILLAAGGAVLFVYLTVCWFMTGRTYGDHVLGLRVVNFRGTRLHLFGAAMRALLYIAFPIGVLYVAVSSANRSLQDIVLRTSVIYDWSKTNPDD